MSALVMRFDELPADAPEPPMGPVMPQPQRWWPWVWAGTASVAVLGAAWLALSMSGDDRIREVHIEGYFERVAASEVADVVQPFLTRALADVDLEAAKLAVERLPWISRARIERVWPDQLRVRVWERQPFALWGEEQLLDGDARRFKPAQPYPEGLPRLGGPEGSEGVIAEMFRALSLRLAEGPFAIKGLLRDARGEWTAQTVSDIALRFGRGDPLSAVEVLQGPARRALEPVIDNVAYVDLRYGNGFSVGWRAQAQATQTGR